MLVLYRNALALRQFVRGDAELTWLDDAGEEVLAFRRGDGFACLVNFGDAAVSCRTAPRCSWPATPRTSPAPR